MPDCPTMLEQPWRLPREKRQSTCQLCGNVIFVIRNRGHRQRHWVQHAISVGLAPLKSFAYKAVGIIPVNLLLTACSRVWLCFHRDSSVCHKLKPDHSCERFQLHGLELPHCPIRTELLSVCRGPARWVWSSNALQILSRNEERRWYEMMLRHLVDTPNPRRCTDFCHRFKLETFRHRGIPRGPISACAVVTQMSGVCRERFGEARGTTL
jgi:hypothetical protein